MFNRFKNLVPVTNKIFRNFNKNYTSKLLKPDEKLSINNKNVMKYVEKLQAEFYVLRSNPSSNENDHLRIREISRVVDAYEKINCVLGNMQSLGDLKNEKDEDMKELILEEKEVYSNILKELETQLFNDLANMSETDYCSSLIFEINAGVGGQEAMLFADELFKMYSNFISFNGWELELLQKDHTDIGGLRYANAIVYGKDAYNMLKSEAGVHRVQRVPATEKSGRMHTSTVSVAVIPRPDDIQLDLDSKCLKIETKRASGAGGQHVNTTDSAVRIVHIPTGTAVECQSERSQLKNKEIALKKLENLLYQKEYDSQQSNKQALRKSQVGSSNRNEKIRTYNFTQDRMTDHRYNGLTIHNLKEFLTGTEILNNVIVELVENDKKERLIDIIEKEE